MVEQAELRKALERWLREATELVADDTNCIIEVTSAPSWRIDSDRKLRFCSRTRGEWTHTTIEATRNLPSADVVRTAMASIEYIAAQMGRVVGTAGGGGGVLTVETVLDYLLPAPHHLEVARTNSEYFAEKYREIERFLLSDEAFSEVHVWILGGVMFDALPVQLANDVWLDRLTDSELAHAYDFGLVSHSFPRELPLTPDLYDCLRSCIRFVRPASRAIADEVGRWDPVRAQETVALKERVSQVLPLAGLQKALVTGQMSYVSGQLHVSGWSYGRLSSVPNMPFPTTSSDAAILSIQRAWGLLATVPESRRGSGLNLAIRRLSYLTDRLRSEDRVLDLMIAAEAFYLADSNSTSELRYRLSLRAGVLAMMQGSSALVARSTYELFLTAYDVRSKVAHGSDFQKYLAKKSISVDEFIDRLSNVIREAIIGVLQSFSTGDIDRWAPDWDDELFALLARA